MQLLTTSGYKNIEDCSIGEQLIAYDISDGHVIINELEGKQWMSADMFEDEYDDDGNLIKTKEQVYIDTYGDVSFYKINDTWVLYGDQSVWANLRVVHGKDLQIGDVIYDDDDNDVTITSIEEVTEIGWWRLTVSGDHSYIADNLTLHNASRYWVGGGSSANWNATANTNWGSASGVQDNSTVPTSTDDVIFDGAGVGGNTSSTISAAITILSINVQAGYTATMTHNAVLTVNGNITLSEGYIIAGTNSITINSTSTITSNGKIWPNSITIATGNLNPITIAGNLVINGALLVTGRNAIINGSTGTETIYCNGLSHTNANSSNLTGTIKIELTGGTLSSSRAIHIDLSINGNVTILTFTFGVKTLTYLKGIINSYDATISISNSCSIINFHKVPLVSASIGLGQTVTMNEFFTGTPNQICRITSTGANIAFSDPFEKIAKYVIVSGCTILRRQQLLIITNTRFNTNRDTSIGIRYINQSPNGFPKNLIPIFNRPLTGPAMGLVSDPNFIKQLV